MESLKRPSGQEKSNLPHESDSNPHAVSGRRKIFEREGETYEEVSFLHEPMERYQDDLMRLDIVINHKKQLLRAAEEKLAAHSATPASAMHLLRDDIADKVAYRRKEVGRLEVTRTATLQRLQQLAKQDQREQDLLDVMPITGVEH